MQLRRTANAGVLLELDGVTILMDGVCREVKPYPTTPPEERDALCKSFPDVVCFTHAHKDHYDPAFAALYEKQTGGAIFGPEALPGCKATMEAKTVKGIRVQPLSSRHIGAAGKTTPHASFILEGSKIIWFLGDAAPMQWKGRQELPKPDVLIAPYAYANTESSWAFTKSLGAERIFLVHMPEPACDTIGLWQAVTTVTEGDDVITILPMQETLTL